MKYVMSGDIPVAEFDEKSQSINILDENRCPVFLRRTKNIVLWLHERAIDGSRRNSRSLKRAFGLSSFADDNETSMLMDAAVITDNFWIKDSGDNRTYQDIRFERNDFFLMALDKDLDSDKLHPSRTPELTNIGCQEKAWKKENDEWWLYKNETKLEIASELITCEIGRLLGFDMAEYTISDDGKYIKTKDFIEGRYNLQHINSWVYDHVENDIKIKEEDYSYNYRVLSDLSNDLTIQYLDIIFLDTLCHNPDRHVKNYGILTDSQSGEILKMAPNYDNNEALGVNKRITAPLAVDGMITGFVQFLRSEGIRYKIPELDKSDLLDLIIKSNYENAYDPDELCEFIWFRYRKLIELIATKPDK